MALQQMQRLAEYDNWKTQHLYWVTVQVEHP